VALPYIKIEYTSDIGTQYYVRLLNFLAFLEKRIVPTIYHNNSNKGVPSVKFDLDIDQNLIYVEPTQISIDPTICFVNKSVILGDNTFTYTDSEKLSDTTPFIIDINGVGYGRLMNIYVNSAFIVSTIKSNTDLKTGELSLYTLLKKIIDGITIALGGLNNLDLFIDETTNEIKIIDKNPLPNRNNILQYFGIPNVTPAIFNLYGYTNDQSSFITEFGFKSELNKDYASQVTTAAQQNGIVVGEGSMPLASLNVGTSDRFKNKMVNDAKLEEELKNSDSNMYKILNESWIKYKEFLAKLEDLTATKSDISTFKTKLKDLININSALRGRTQKKIDQNAIVNTNTATVQKINTTPSPQIIQPDPNWVVQPVPQILSTSTPSSGPNPTGTIPGGPTAVYSPGLVDSNISGDIEELNNKSKAYVFSGFLPLNLQLTMKGLSGMKIGQKYIVDDNFLPASYPGTLDFLIKNIRHQISNQQWTTQLESFAVSQTEGVKKSPVVVESKFKSTEFITFEGLAFYFENDIPLPPPKESAVQSYDTYFQSYATAPNINKYDSESTQLFDVNSKNGKTKDFFNNYVIDNFKKFSEGNDSFVEKAYRILSENKGSITLRLVGSASWTAATDYNFRLSQRRIKSIKIWLESTKLGPYIKQGILKIEEKPAGEGLILPKTEKETYGTIINCTTPVKDKNNKEVKVYSVDTMACRRVKVEVDFISK
jgi:hypothetical protein